MAKQPKQNCENSPTYVAGSFDILNHISNCRQTPERFRGLLAYYNILILNALRQKRHSYRVERTRNLKIPMQL